MSAQFRADQARIELRETKEAFEAVRLNIFNDLANTRPEEGALREALYVELQALEKVKSRLVSVINDGAVSAHIELVKSQGF